MIDVYGGGCQLSPLLMGIGVFPTESKHSAGKVVEAVEEAERAGFDRAWLVDSQGLFPEVYVTLTQCIARTKRIHLGTGVTNPLTRHLSVTARAIATLDEFGRGRVRLGLGAGDTSMKYMRLPPLRPDECEEAVRCLRSLLAGREGTFRGETIHPFDHYEPREIPIHLAANGRRMLRTAGRCADGVIVSVGADPAIIQYVFDSVREGAESAGRDPAEIPVSLHVGCDVSEDRKQARENVKTYVARRLIAPLPRSLTGFTKAEQERVKEAYSLAGHLQVNSSHARLVREEWIDRLSLAGTPEECLEKVRLFEALGVSELFLLPTTSSAVGLIRTFADSILPKLRSFALD